MELEDNDIGEFLREIQREREVAGSYRRAMIRDLVRKLVGERTFRNWLLCPNDHQEIGCGEIHKEHALRDFGISPEEWREVPKV